MSTTPIWSLAAQRSELGKASKGVIYLVKIATGGAVAGLLWLVSLGALPTVLIAAAGIFVTTKICYYLNTGEYPDSWDSAADWCCDGSLHFAWYAVYAAWHHDYRTAGLIAGLWLVSYPFSCE